MATQVERLLASGAARAGTYSAMAKVKLGLGDTTAALDLFERALRERDPFFASEPLRSPLYVPIHGSARFARIVQAAGLDSRRVTAPGCC